MTGAEAIAAERQRQIEQERWTSAHDDEHDGAELAWAAVCYAAPEPIKARSYGASWEEPWPWAREWDKRHLKTRRQQLIIAGALIAAEIDRLQRREARALSRSKAQKGD